MICKWLLIVLGLEVPRKVQAMNRVWPVVPYLVPLKRQEIRGTLRPGAACLGFVNLLRDFRKVHSMSEDRLFVQKSHRKWLELVGFQGITRAG